MSEGGREQQQEREGVLNGKRLETSLFVLTGSCVLYQMNIRDVLANVHRVGA